MFENISVSLSNAKTIVHRLVTCFYQLKSAKPPLKSHFTQFFWSQYDAMVFLFHIDLLVVFWGFFLAFDFCRFCLVIRFFHQRPITSNFEGFSIPDFMFRFKQGHYWYHFLTSLVWRGPSRTQSQHYTTRISRRRFILCASTSELKCILLSFCDKFFFVCVFTWFSS